MQDLKDILIAGLIVLAILILGYYISGGWSIASFYEHNTKACANYWQWFTFRHKIKQFCWEIKEIK